MLNIVRAELSLVNWSAACRVGVLGRMVVIGRWLSGTRLSSRAGKTRTSLDLNDDLQS